MPMLLIYLLFHSIEVFANANPFLNLKSDSAILMDAETGQVLFEKNMNRKEYPASITKVMTGMLALERSNLSDTITMTKEAVFSVERDSSHIALDVGEQLLMKYALYALAIESANDAANGIGVYVSGSLEEFANLMNKRAKELGALNTHFVTTNGLNNINHYTTAYDMALIMKQAIKTPHFLEFFNNKSFDIPPTNMQNKIRYLHNKNSLLTGRLKYEGLIASKTGWTSEAKHTLVTAARRGNRVLIVVSLNSPKQGDKYEDTMKLFDYGFNEFKEVSINTSQLLKALPLNDSSKSIKRFINGENPIVKRLIHKSLSIEDIALDYQIDNSVTISDKKLKLLLGLKNNNEIMYSNIGSVEINESVKALYTPDAPVTKIIASILLKIIKIIAKIFMYLVLFLIGFIIFKKILIKYLRYKRDMKKKHNK